MNRSNIKFKGDLEDPSSSLEARTHEGVLASLFLGVSRSQLSFLLFLEFWLRSAKLQLILWYTAPHDQTESPR